MLHSETCPVNLYKPVYILNAKKTASMDNKTFPANNTKMHHFQCLTLYSTSPLIWRNLSSTYQSPNENMGLFYNTKQFREFRYTNV